MNPEAQAKLDEILKKEPTALSADERIFLRARSGYLKKSQLDEYKDVLGQEEAPSKAPEEDKIPYKELLAKARAQGYTGKNAKRAFLEDQLRQRDPFTN